MEIIANVAVQGQDDAPDSNNDFPSSMEIDYIKYWKQMPCIETLSIDDLADLNLSDEVYNVLVANSIQIGGNITLVSGQQLALIAGEEIVLDPGFTVGQGSVFSTTLNSDACPGWNKLASTNTNETNFNNSAITNFSVYPNPPNTYIRIKNVREDQINYEMTLINELGKVISKINLMNEAMIDIENLPAGMYIIYISYDNNKKIEMHKLVKS